MTTPGLSFAAIALLVVGQWGCAVAPPPRPSHATLAQMGSVGVVAVELAPETDLSSPLPVKPLAAVVGMTAGFGVGLGYGAVNTAVCCIKSGHPLSCIFYAPLCGIATTGVMMGAGVVEGLDKGITVTEWLERSRTLSRAAAEPEARETLRDAVIAAAAERRTAPPVVPLPEGGPRQGKAPPSYRPLAATGVDTVLEVVVLRLDFERVTEGALSGRYGPAPSWEKVFDPSLQLIVEARARLVRVADDAVLSTRPYRYSGAARLTFVEWARASAEAFREVRHTALQRLGEEIASDFFGPVPVPASTPGAPLPPPPFSDKFFDELRGEN